MSVLPFARLGRCMSAFEISRSRDLSGRTAVVTDLALAASHGDVDEAASVSESLLGAALRSLLLLLLLDLRGLRLDLACIANSSDWCFSSFARSVSVLMFGCAGVV